MGEFKVPATRPQGSLLYSFSSPHRRGRKTLYVNSVGRFSCVNSCRFCSREDAIRGKPNIYEKKAGTNLYLPKAPSAEAILLLARECISRNPIDEIVFVGLGEPLLNFPAVRDSIRGLRSLGYSGKISLDTNGAVARWKNMPKQLKKAGMDSVRISVNAINAAEYSLLCRPSKKDAFSNVCSFLRGCLDCGIEAFASFVVGFDDGEARTREPEDYLSFAVGMGVDSQNVLCREYVPPYSEEPTKPKPNIFGDVTYEVRPPRMAVSFPRYKELGGRLPARTMGKLMAQGTPSWAKATAAKINYKLDVPLEGFALELLERFMCMKEFRTGFRELCEGGPARDELLSEIAIIREASELH